MRTRTRVFVGTEIARLWRRFNFATEVLDEGHIIAQESRHIDVLGPTPSTAELTDEGRQVEVAALMEGVRRYVRGEVFALSDRTMYFPA